MQYRTKKDVDEAIRKLRELSFSFSRQYLYSNDSKANFSLEIDKLINYAESESGSYCISYHTAYSIIDEEIKYLERQAFDMESKKIKLFIEIEKKRKIERNKNITTLIAKNVGFVSGGMQVSAGVGACAASFGLACISVGMPLILQGSNNVYENGNYILFREEKNGIVRDAYHYAANSLGYSEDTADIVYGSVDIALSGYGLASNTVRPNAWRLYRHIESDFVRGWKQMGTLPLFYETASNALTGFSMYKSYKKEGANE